MSAAIEQIKTAYEVNEMTVEEIAQEFPNYDIAAIKAALMHSSTKYRKACGLETENDDGLNFTDDQLRRVNAVIFEAAIAAETADGQPDWKTRSQNAQYIRDDKKGRKEAVRHIAGNTFNILAFNDMLAKARQMSEGAKKQIIDITNK